MEIVIGIVLIIVVSKPLLDSLSKLISRITNLVKQLQSGQPKQLGDGKDIELSLKIGSKEQKRNLCRKHKSPKRLD